MELLAAQDACFGQCLLGWENWEIGRATSSRPTSDSLFNLLHSPRLKLAIANNRF